MPEPDPQLIETLLDEFAERLRRGETPSIAAYEAAHPECAAQIRELFPAVQAMEQIALRRQQNRGPALVATGMPAQLGDFHIIREIGRGGMGIVYEAEQASLSRHVAVKVLPPSALHRPAILQRFHREALTAARLHHTNIVPIFGVGEDQGFHYIVMQLIQGVGLDKILARLSCSSAGHARPGTSWPLPSTIAAGGTIDESAAVAQALLRGEFHRKRFSNASSVSPVTDVAGLTAPALPPPEPLAQQPLPNPEPPPIIAPAPPLGPNYWLSVARIGVQAADALHYAHLRRTLHRDIKPANLLIDLQGVVWVSDFGLAKAMEQDDLSQTGDIVGTLRFMAPERFRGQADARSDIYSLGLTLYELLTLRPAFDDPSPSALIQKINTAAPVRPRKLNPNIPRDLETVVLKAAARESDHRYRTAEELAADLQRFLDDQPIRARRVGPVERLWRWSRRNPAVAGLVGLAAALLILVAVTATVSYVKTTRAYALLETAMIGESQQRQKAEAVSKLTLQALERIFEQYVPSRVAGTSELALGDSAGSAVRVAVQPVLSQGAAALLENMLVFYERLSEQNADDAELRRKVADAHRRVGDIHRRLGHLEQAHAAYLKAIDDYQQLRRESAEDMVTPLEIARIDNELGDLHWAARRQEEGPSFHAAALEILRPGPTSPAMPPQHQYELARTYYFLGRGGPPDAAPGREPPGAKSPRPGHDRSQSGSVKNLYEAIRLLEPLTTAHHDVADYRHLLACCYREIPAGGNASAQQPDFEFADKAIAILQKLVTEYPDVADYRYDLSKAYAKLDFGAQPPNAALYNAAEGRLRQSLSILQKLVAEHPNVPDYAASQVHSLYALAEVQRRTRRGDTAEISLRKAVAIQAALVEQFPAANAYLAWQAILADSLAKLLSERGQSTNDRALVKEARTLLETAVAALEQLRKRDPQATYADALLGRCYKNLADVLHELGDDQQADEMLDRGRGHRGNR